MPRALDGTVTLVVGNPVAAGTAISADVQNATTADFASMIEDSLSRSGKGGMTAAMQFAKGTAATPAMTFIGDTDTGVNSDTGGQVDLVANGTAALEAVSSGVTIPGTLAVGGDATITGDLALTGTAAITGVATFTATPVLSAGITGIVKTNLPAATVAIGAPATFGGISTVVDSFSTEITLAAATGRPIAINVQSGDPTADCYMNLRADGGGDRTGNVFIYRSINGGAAASIASYTFHAPAGSLDLAAGTSIAIGTFIDNPGAGSIAYRLKYSVSNAGATMVNEGMVIAAYEL